jgi:hypothetical protein
VTVHFDMATAQKISGRWAKNDGDAGVFHLSSSHTSQADASAPTPIEFVSRSRQLPKFRLYRPDLIDIALKLKQVIKTPNDVVVNARLDGIDTTTVAQDFFRRPNLPDEIEAIRISPAETKSFAPKSITLAFANEIPPSITINSDDRVWVNGISDDLDKHMRRYYSWFLEKFQKARA